MTIVLRAAAGMFRGRMKAKGWSSMSSDFNNALEYAHRKNMERYQRLLKTYLADVERRFIEQRLAEERAALQKISEKDHRVDTHAVEQGVSTRCRLVFSQLTS